MLKLPRVRMRNENGAQAGGDGGIDVGARTVADHKCQRRIEDGVASALTAFDDYYPQDNGQSALQQLLAQLANALPFDLDEIEPGLQDYRNLDPKWHAWANVEAAAARLSVALLERLPP